MVVPCRRRGFVGDVDLRMEARHISRPFLDNGLKGGNSESPEMASICNHFGVCMSVIKLQVTVFDPVS